MRQPRHAVGHLFHMQNDWTLEAYQPEPIKAHSWAPELTV
jgi:hypothetical protein